MPANTLPADFEFPEELPADFAFPEDGYMGDVRTTIPAEQPRGWLEAFFPRVADAPNAFAARAAALGNDLASAPGRAYESSVPAWRAPGESFQQALGRTGPRADEGWIKQGTSTFLRDPANIPLAALAALTGGATVAPWLARLGWAGKGVATGGAMGSTVAATRQAENVAAGRPMDAMEVAQDVGIGGALGLGSSLLGRGLQAAGNRAAPAAMKLAKVPSKHTAGVERATPEMMRRGVLGWSPADMQRRYAAMGDEIDNMYNVAKAGTEGTPAVPLGLYGEQAKRKLSRLADRSEVLAPDEAAAAEWIMAAATRPRTQSMIQGPAMVDVPTAINARSMARKAAGSFESNTTQNVRRDALVDAADEFAAGINERIGVVAPAVRKVDEFAAPYYAFRPYMEALARRGSNYDVGLTELGAATAGATVGSAGGPVGTAIGMATGGGMARLQRHPLYPYLLNKLGQVAAIPGNTIPLGTMLLRGSQTDNARGGR